MRDRKQKLEMDMETCDSYLQKVDANYIFKLVHLNICLCYLRMRYELKRLLTSEESVVQQYSVIICKCDLLLLLFKFVIAIFCVT